MKLKFIIILFISYPLFSQKTLVRFIINDTFENVFLAGNFNNWNPSDSNFRFLKNENTSILQINLLAGAYEYKCTKGNWQTVEQYNDGTDTKNRHLLITGNDTNVIIAIQKFKTDTEKTKATVKNPYRLLFNEIDYKNQKRKLRIYLPPQYNQTNKKYPVLYMLDAQNLFDKSTAAFGNEWEIDEQLDSLATLYKNECIIVGIDNSNNRMKEYLPYASQEIENFEGDQHANWILQKVVPFIDKNYKTKAFKKNRFIAGSSMGGLMCFYIANKYPNYFNTVGVFSPAFWLGLKKENESYKTHNLFNNMAKISKDLPKTKMFIYANEAEGKSMMEPLNVMLPIINNSNKNVFTIILKNGGHNEKSWSAVFGTFYKYCFTK